MMWMWPRSWRLGLEAVSRRSSASAWSRLAVGTPRPRLYLELWRHFSLSRLCLNCQRLSLGLQGLSLASFSTKKASCPCDSVLKVSDPSRQERSQSWWWMTASGDAPLLLLQADHSACDVAASCSQGWMSTGMHSGTIHALVVDSVKWHQHRFRSKTTGDKKQADGWPSYVGY